MSAITLSAIVLLPACARAEPLPGDQQGQPKQDDVDWPDEIRQRRLYVLDPVQDRRDDQREQPDGYERRSVSSVPDPHSCSVQLRVRLLITAGRFQSFQHAFDSLESRDEISEMLFILRRAFELESDCTASLDSRAAHI